MYGKILIIQCSYNFKKSLKKIPTNFCGSLNQIKQFGDKKNYFSFFFGKNGYHIIYIYENCTTSNILMATTKIFQIKLKLHKFFSTANFNIRRSPGNTKIGFFPFPWIIFFKQAENSFFVWLVYICLDQILITWIFNLKIIIFENFCQN